jgi:ribosomal protein S18 acetylase RimI-like enzyme
MIFIRTAGINEINIIHSLAHCIWQTSYKEILSADQMEYMLDMMYSHESLQYQIEKQKHNFLIIYEEDKAVGFAAYFPKYDISHAIFRLDKIYVLPELHGKGLGKKLIQHIISEIKPKGVSILELNVNRNNKAISFYKKLGFIITKEVNVPIGEGYFMNDYVMAVTL